MDNYVRKTPNTVRNVFIEREYLIMSRLLSYQITRLVLIEVPSSGRFHKLKPTTFGKNWLQSSDGEKLSKLVDCK